MTKLATEDVLGYQVYVSGCVTCVAEIAEWIKTDGSPKARWLACINPHSYAIGRKHIAFSTALRSADWLIPDGVGIVLASRMLGGQIRERITGSDVFAGVMQDLDLMGGSVFFLGASDETLNALCMRVQQDFPSVRIAGSYSPPFAAYFSREQIDKMVSVVNASNSDVLWVGMTSPKQDLWIFSNLHRLNVRFAAGVGAVFDFYAGTVRRSHPIFQRLGLEWLPRLLRQPAKLWQRMFVSAPIFIFCVLKARLKWG